MVRGKNRIPYWIDWRLTGLAEPDYGATISFGLPIEPEDSQYGKYRVSHRPGLLERAWGRQHHSSHLSTVGRDGRLAPNVGSPGGGPKSFALGVGQGTFWGDLIGWQTSPGEGGPIVANVHDDCWRRSDSPPRRTPTPVSGQRVSNREHIRGSRRSWRQAYPEAISEDRGLVRYAPQQSRLALWCYHLVYEPRVSHR